MTVKTTEANSIRETSPNSRQLNYYYRNKETINKKKRNNYRKNQLTNIPSNQKSCNCNEDFLKYKTGYLDLDVSENKPILSLISLCKRAYDTRCPETENSSNIGSKSTFSFYQKHTKIDSELQEIIFWMSKRPMLDFSFADFKFIFSHINIHTLRRKIQKLVNLKWLLRTGHGDIAFYVLNPFFEKLLELNESYIWLSSYASLKMDFLDLLNIPLISFLKSGRKAKKIEITPIKSRIGLIKTIFNYGYVRIKIHTDSETYEAIYPVNLHGRTVFSGKPERNFIPEYCLPINWSLFDVKDCKTFSKKKNKKTFFIHFDNSISILVNHSNYYFDYRQWSNSLKKWQTCQYIEVRSFEDLKELFEFRFVKGYRRNELFNNLDMKPVDHSHKNRTRRTYNRKQSKIEPVINDEHEQREKIY